MNILITGGAGYIGSHVAKRVAQAGHNPVTFDNLSTGHASAVKWGPLVENDLLSQNAIRSALENYRIDAVIHLAASSDVGASMKSPGVYFRNNVVNTINLLDAMVDVEVRSIVFSSSAAVYGNRFDTPIYEDYPTNPTSPYGESKKQCEAILAWYGRAHGIGSISLRYFNAAGSDPDGELGEEHHPETHLIPLALDASFEKPLTIFGTDYATPDGTAIRDYVHVADLAEAHVLALGSLDRFQGPLNLGTGQGHSVLDVCAAVRRATGRPVPAIRAPNRPGDPPSLVAAADLAERVLGWVPQFPSLDVIVQHAFQWKVGLK